MWARWPVVHSLIGPLAEAKEAADTPIRWWRKRAYRERSRLEMASRRKRRSRGRWSEWSILAGAGWASGHACASAWRPGSGSRPGTEGSGRVRPRASAGAWSWPRSPGSAEDRGYRRRASLLGQVKSKAREGKKKGAKAGLGIGWGDWARELHRSKARREGPRSGSTGVREETQFKWAGRPYLCGHGSASPSDV